MRNFIRISSLALALAAGIGLPAIAGTEEDAAAPVGSFTSDMAVPHTQFAARHDGHFGWHRVHRMAMRMPRAAAE
ncbi:MAG TPA: hypothetical protein VMU31_05475 [Rhizomicrobium sp.]|nr:hypothetical protein [Rhizomicrobium sp.]